MKKPILPTFNYYLLCILTFLILILILLHHQSYSNLAITIDYTTKSTQISKFKDNREETNTSNDYPEEIGEIIMTNLTNIK